MMEEHRETDDSLGESVFFSPRLHLHCRISSSNSILRFAPKFLYPFNCLAKHEVLLGIICLLFGVRLFVPAALHQLPFLLAFWLLKLRDKKGKSEVVVFPPGMTGK